MAGVFYFTGRPDGLGNRIEELIRIQEYCESHDKKCIYIWQNTSFRNYSVCIELEHIEIQTSISVEERKLLSKNEFSRTFNYNVNYNFNFSVDNDLKYDTIIHIRATDRIVQNNNHKDFLTVGMLDSFINKTIKYINNDDTISTYTIVTDDNRLKERMVSEIDKEYVDLLYNCDVEKDWLDFYYLTKPQKYVIMCSQFSSYSICASILGNKKLMVFRDSLKSNLPRYKANLGFID